VLEARFSLTVFEEQKRKDPEGWNSARNAMGRGIYSQALREKARLEAVSDDLLEREFAAIAP
jgi:hypothetical protein